MTAEDRLAVVEALELEGAIRWADRGHRARFLAAEDEQPRACLHAKVLPIDPEVEGSPHACVRCGQVFAAVVEE